MKITYTKKRKKGENKKKSVRKKRGSGQNRRKKKKPNSIYMLFVYFEKLTIQKAPKES